LPDRWIDATMLLMDRRHPDNSRIEFSNVSDFAVLTGLLTAVIVVFVALVVYRCVQPVKGDSPGALLGLLSCLILTVALGPALMVRHVYKGWVDPEGIHSQPLFYSSRVLRWDEIKKIQWTHGGVSLSDGKITVRIAWQMFQGDARPGAKEFIRRQLEPMFNLTLSERPKSSWQRIAVMTTPLLAVVLTLYLYVLHDPTGRFAGWAVGAMLLLGVSLPYVLLIVKAWKDRKNPQHPLRWRSRHISEVPI
jgi:hypothetical protein